MISPMIPEDEKQRLEKLRALKILDSAPEERFDRLTRMAKRMFGVDISVLSLIDDGRQWFKSKASENELPDETTREISFCGHAILGDDVLSKMLWRITDSKIILWSQSILISVFMLVIH